MIYAIVVTILSVCLAINYSSWSVDAFQHTATPSIVSQYQIRNGHINTNTALYGLLGRFRNKRKVEQVKTIRVGDSLPTDVDVERLVPLVSSSSSDESNKSEIISEAVSIQEILGSKKALLVGMPGAFTTTCSTEHLPGYIRSAKKLQSLGIESIAVVTTNDRFVNQEWSTQQGLTTDPMITMLCDADGDFVKSIGLADDMGFGVGVRSKRFAMITDNGVVTTLLTDEGMDDCSATSAANVIKILTPETATGSTDGAVEIDGKVILGGVGAIVVAILATILGGGDGSSKPPTTKSTVVPQSRIAPQQKQQKSSETSFSLLNEYMKN